MVVVMHQADMEHVACHPQCDSPSIILARLEDALAVWEMASRERSSD